MSHASRHPDPKPASSVSSEPAPSRPMLSPAEAGTLTTTALLTSLVGGAPTVDDSIAELDGAIAAAADVAGASPADQPRRAEQPRFRSTTSRSTHRSLRR